MRKTTERHPVHDLGELARAWRGWSLQGPQLITPEGWELPMPWIRSLPLQREALHSYRVATARQRQEAQEAQALVTHARDVIDALAKVEAAVQATRKAMHEASESGMARSFRARGPGTQAALHSGPSTYTLPVLDVSAGDNGQ